MKKKVLFFGFGYSHAVVRELIKRSDWIKESFCISLSSAYEKEEIEIFGEKNLYFIEDFKSLKSDSYNVLAKNIDADKKRFTNTKGQLKDVFYESIYLNIKEILSKIKPDLLVFTQNIETPDGLILYECAKKKNITCVFSHYMRFLGGSIISDSPYEGEIKFDTKNLKIFDFDFEIGEYPSIYNNVKPKPFKTKNLKQRIIRFLLLIIKRPKNFTIKVFRWKLGEFLNYREFRSFVNKIYYSRKSITPDLSIDYVFYPLHISPEASINIPNPFFIDQLRAIDMVRYNLPKNTLLYVKEHPGGFYRRHRKFYRELEKRSRVRIIKENISTKELILNSKCVVSVTGTACFEAFIWGKPSITLSKSFFSEFLCNDLESLKTNNLKSPKNKDINRALSILKNNSYDFIGLTPDYHNVLNKKNLDLYSNSIKSFLKKRSFF